VTRRYKDEPWHTYYSGNSRIRGLIPFIGEVTAKRLVEPALAFGVGFLITQVNRPLGAYLECAAAGMFIVVNALLVQERGRILDLRDSLCLRRADAEELRID